MPGARVQQPVEAAGGLRERGRAEHVGGAGLVTMGRVRPGHGRGAGSGRHAADGAAAGEVGLGGVEPVAPPDQRARAYGA
ncbi:hypothetical protein BJF78_21155 [Pseudonocardia sp. CNS-139]|nr:hypothetical protein BJF78_21155 [Pseudonocardia sp. CNS-139]